MWNYCTPFIKMSKKILPILTITELQKPNTKCKAINIICMLIDFKKIIGYKNI